MALTPSMLRPFALGALLTGLCLPLSAQQARQANPPPPPGALTLFENVRIFDGKGSALSAPSNVLIRGNRIERISANPIPLDGQSVSVRIEGGGRTLMA